MISKPILPLWHRIFMAGKLKLKHLGMPVFFQHQINDHTRLGVWKIEEPESFFRDNVPMHRDVTHPHKRLQHLAGRFLLRYLFPDFPYELIRIAETRKPYLPGEEFHFSIAHSGDYAAAIVSRTSRVGIDVEEVREQVGRLIPKFLSADEIPVFELSNNIFMYFSRAFRSRKVLSPL